MPDELHRKYHAGKYGEEKKKKKPKAMSVQQKHVALAADPNTRKYAEEKRQLRASSRGKAGSLKDIDVEQAKKTAKKLRNR